VADVTQCISDGLHLLAKLVGGQVALSHGVELVTKEDGAGNLVRLEEARNRSP
jgi:hypothetical protein